jgi:hypothetical protein
MHGRDADCASDGAPIAAIVFRLDQFCSTPSDLPDLASFSQMNPSGAHISRRQARKTASISDEAYSVMRIAFDRRTLKMGRIAYLSLPLLITMRQQLSLSGGGYTKPGQGRMNDERGTANSLIESGSYRERDAPPIRGELAA